MNDSVIKEKDVSAVKEVLKQGANVNIIDGFLLFSVLSFLPSTKDHQLGIKMLNALLSDKDIDVNIREQTTPLIFAIQLYDFLPKMYETKVLKSLLNHEDINVNLPDINGVTPFMWAVDMDNLKAVQLLLGSSRRY